MAVRRGPARGAVTGGDARGAAIWAAVSEIRSGISL